MAQEIKFLKKRAKEFFESAKRDFGEGRYNLSAFHLEQAIQLWLKYLIGKKLGDWPKLHYLSKLISEFAKVYEEEEEKILEFYNQNELFFDNLDTAYITSRYLPREFSKNLVNMLLEKAEEFLRLTEKITKENFNEVNEEDIS